MQCYVMYDVILFEKLRFRPATTRKFSKISTLDRFKKPAFSLLETPFTYGRKAKTEKRNLSFQNIRIRVDRALKNIYDINN